MYKVLRHLKRGIAILIGLPLFVVGLILIPLPGPGLLLCFIALAILSRAFDWADRYFVQTKDKLKIIYVESAARADRFEKQMNDKWDKYQATKSSKK